MKQHTNTLSWESDQERSRRQSSAAEDCRKQQMNRERRTETEHLINEVQELVVECRLAQEKGSGKYTTTEAWLKAGGELSDKIADLLTEAQDAAVDGSHKEQDHDDLLASSEHLEEALEDVNDAVDALGDSDYEDAAGRLEDTIAALRRAMG